MAHLKRTNGGNWSFVAAVAMGAFFGSLLAYINPISQMHVTIAPSVTAPSVSQIGLAPRYIPSQQQTRRPLVARSAAMDDAATPSTVSSTNVASDVATAGIVGAGAAAVGAILTKALMPAEEASSNKHGMSRRVATGLGLAAILPFTASGAKAEIIPDDDDPELLALAKANRQSKLAAERKLQEEVFGTKGDPKYAVLQAAVASLATIGQKLEAGTVDRSLIAASSELKITELANSLSTLSTTSEAKELGVQFLKDLKALQSAVTSGTVGPARPAYIKAVASLKAWAASTGADKQIAGL